MKKITKFFLFTIICFWSVNSFAQTFGVRGGLSMANIMIEDWDSDYGNKKINPGFHFGLTVDFPLSDALSFESGLYFSVKGVRITDEDGDDKYVMSINSNYIDVPIMIKFSKEINEGLKVYGTAGPYIGYALSGKEKYKETYDGDTSTETEKIKFGNDEDENDFKALDYGLSIGGGVDIGVIQVGVYFDLGLANFSFNDAEQLKNRVLKFSVAYTF